MLTPMQDAISQLGSKKVQILTIGNKNQAKYQYKAHEWEDGHFPRLAVERLQGFNTGLIQFSNTVTESASILSCK